MTIQPISGEPLKSSEARRTHESEERTGRVVETAPVVRPEQADRVEISREGRAQAEKAGLAGSPADAPAEERLEAIRLRIQQGTYDAPETAEEVARRILDSGDLGF